MSAGDADVVCAGILVGDHFVPPLPRLPEAGELLVTDRFLTDSGGCAANTATDLVRLGVDAAVVGRVGADALGDFILEDLRAKGVDVTAVRRSDRLGTSETVILPVVGEDRRYIHTFGANAEVSAADIEPAAVTRARAFVLGGYLALPNLATEGLADLFALARRAGTMTVLDVVAGETEDLVATRLAPVLPHVDFFVPNTDEARLVTGESEPEAQGRALLDLGAGAVVITRGAAGATYVDAEQVAEVPALPVSAIDPSGAGDAFTAGLVAGLLDQLPLHDTLLFAAAVAASACRSLGCTTGVFDRDEARRYLAEQDVELAARPHSRPNPI